MKNYEPVLEQLDVDVEKQVTIGKSIDLKNFIKNGRFFYRKSIR